MTLQNIEVLKRANQNHLGCGKSIYTPCWEGAVSAQDIMEEKIVFYWVYGVINQVIAAGFRIPCQGRQLCLTSVKASMQDLRC